MKYKFVLSLCLIMILSLLMVGIIFLQNGDEPELLVTEFSSDGVERTPENSLPSEMEDALMATLNNWKQNGSNVYYYDDRVLISATDNTNSPIIRLMSKQYSGDINIAFGFNTQDIKPVRAEHNKHYVNTTFNYTCEYEFNHTQTPTKHFVCYEVFEDQPNGTLGYTNIIFERDFEWGNIEQKTAYWTEDVETWDDISGAFDKETFFINDTDTWYLKKNFNVNANQTYELKLHLQPKGINTPPTKYWIAFWPSDETMAEAIANGHFYALDPWTAELNTNLVSYYKLDNNIFTDSIGSNNGTNNGTTNTSGIIKDGRNFDGTTDVNIGTLDNFVPSIDGNTSYVFWFKTTSTNTFETLLGSAVAGGKILKIQLNANKAGSNTPGRVYFFMRDEDSVRTYGATDSSAGFNDGEWHQLIVTLEVSTSVVVGIYVDNVTYNFDYTLNDLSDNWAGGISNPFSLGAENQVTVPISLFTGQIDEVAIFNKSLVLSERSQLYNNGMAISYTDSFGGDTPETQLLTPEDNTVSVTNNTIDSVNFQCNSSSSVGVTQLELFINDTSIITSNNVSVAQNLTINSNIDLPNGNFTWYCEGTNVNGATNSTSRTLKIKRLTIFLDSPDDNYLSEINYVIFNYTLDNSNTNIANTTLYIDGVANVTNSSGTPGFYSFNVTDLSFDAHTYSIVAVDTSNIMYNNSTRSFVVSTLDIQLNSPEDNLVTADPSINFNCSSSFSGGVVNLTLVIDGTDNLTITNSTPSQSLSLDVDRTLSEGDHNWTCLSSTLMVSASTVTRDLTIDTIKPFINVTAPPSVFSTLGVGDSVNLNWTITDDNLDSCWYYYSTPPCRQESATNISQEASFITGNTIENGVCDLNFEGSYYCNNTVVPTFNCAESDLNAVRDGKYNTFSGAATAGSDYSFFVNYTKPNFFSDTNDNITWGVKITGASIQEISIPRDCIEYNSTQIILSAIHPDTYSSRGDMDIKCYNGTWKNITTIVGIVGEFRFYEENINWSSPKEDVICSDNTTTFSYIDGLDSITLFANDTAGNINSSTTSWIVLLTENNFSFSPFDYETSRATFNTNFTTSSQILSITPFLNYNGTLYTTTSSCTSGNCFIETDIDLPLLSEGVESENRTFFFEVSGFSANETFLFNTTSRQQNVSRIHLETCDATYTVEYFNFTAFDEQTLEAIQPFRFTSALSTWLGSGTVRRDNNFTELSTNDVNICFSPSIFDIYLNGTVNYDEVSPFTNYTQRNHYFDNNSYSNVSTSIPLGLLTSEDVTTFILAVRDADLLPMSNVLIYTQRYYPGAEKFLTVAVSKTDDNGKTVGFFEAETVEYRFVLKRNGQTLLITNKQKMTPEESPFTLTFTVGEDEGAAWAEYEEIDDLTKSLTFDKATNIVTFSYIDTSEEFTLARLIVEKLNASGLTNPEVCDVNLSQSTGSLTCNVTTGTGGYSARALITRDSDTSLVQQLVFNIEDFSTVAGNLGLFLGWFIILISAFAFRFNEIAGIILINLSVIFVNLIGFIAFGPVFISAMVALSLMILVVLER